MRTYWLFIFLVVVVLGGLEVYLRVTGKCIMYFDFIGRQYRYYCNAANPTWYVIHKEETFTLPNDDLKYLYSTNRFGIMVGG